MLELWAVVAVVILVSAFCSTCEAALYSVPQSYIETLVSNNSQAGRVLRSMREKVDRPITAILTLNTIANTAGAAVAGALAARAFGAEWLVTFSALFTLAILFFSEVIPKTVGVVYSRPIAVLLALPLQLLVIAFMPVIWISGLATRAIARAAPQNEVNPEEIVVMARLGQKAGAIDEGELAVIQNILSVRTRTVREIMTPRSVVFTLDADATIEETGKSERLYFHSRVPVYVGNRDEIVGVVYRRDILAAIAEGKLDRHVRDFVKPVYFVPTIVHLDDLLERFLERHQHLFVVINEFSEFSGVVTLEDVLEAILGAEIVDEFDEAVDMQELARRRRDQAAERMRTI